MWTIALYGTNTRHQLDSDGELPLFNLPADPATNPYWRKVNIYGASPIYTDESTTLETPGGYQVEQAVLRRQLKLQLATISFPDDMEIIEYLKNLKLKKEIYLYNIDYPITLHKSNFAVRINMKTIVEDDYENGEKIITLDVVKTKAE